MPSLAGITEIIGIRAEIIGVRQYLADGREIERINQRIANSTKQVDAASVRSVSASRATAFAMIQEAKAKDAAALASKNLAIAEEAEAKASANAVLAARAAATRPTGINGQFISQAAASQVLAQQAQLEAEATAARDRANVSLREANALQATATAATAVREAAVKRAGATTVGSEEASAKAIAANVKARELELTAVLAVTRAEELEAAARAAATRVAPASGLVSATGQPLANTANTAILAEQAKLEKEAAQARKEATVATKEAANASKFAAAAIVVEDAAIERDLVAKEHQLGLEKQLAEAQRSRLNAATTTGAIAATAVIGITAAAAISSAAKYQQELSKINVLTSATDAQTKELGADFLKLSTQIPVSAADLAGAAYTVLSSGIKDTNTALEASIIAGKAAVASQTDIKDIITAVTGVLNSYPKGTYTATSATEILFATVREGTGEFKDFANVLGRVAPVAAALGVPLEQVGASLAVLTNGGLNAEEAATGLRAILQDIAKGDASPEAAAALKSVGLTFEDLRKSIQSKGLPQTLAQLINLFQGNLAALEPVIPNIRALTSLYSAFGDSGEKVSVAEKGVVNSVGIVDQAFAKTKNNVANLSQLFSNELNVALIQIGNAVLPSVTKALQDLIGWIDRNKEAISSFVSQGLQALIDVITSVVRGIGLVSEGLAGIVGSADSTKAALLLIGTGLAWALPGGPYLKGLALILTLMGQIQDKKIDLPLGLGSIGGRGSELQILKENQKELQQELKDLNSGGPGGIKGKILDIVTSLPGPLHNQPSQNIQENPELAAARANIQKKLDENTAAIAAAEQKEADAKKQLEEATKPLTDQTIPKLTTNVGGLNEAAKQTSEELKKVAQDFKKNSEALSEVAPVTKDLEKFGQGIGLIHLSLQDAAKAGTSSTGAGFSASQAGEIAGIDAVIRAQERAAAEAYNYEEAIAAITAAWQQSADTGRALAEELAQSTLALNQTALSNVFSNPTREVADLGVGLSRQRLNTAVLTRNADPRIFVLQQQLKDIDKQISQTNKANTLANRAAERQKRDQQAAQKAQQKAQQDQLDAIKLANLQAQIAAERQLAAIQKLIDANNKAASDLQEAFLKSNNDLQQQINKAIGQGDSATALKLVDQQRAATKQYRDQSKALQKSTQDLTSQQKAAQEAEAERQRQAQLAEALAQSSQKQQDSTDNLTSSIDDNKEAQDAQTSALEDSKQAIQDQIDALQKPIDASQKQEKVIQDNIDVYEAQTAILKAQGVAANKTLLTQAQQKQAAEHFTKQIEYASEQARQLAKNFYDFIPGAHDADEAVKTLRGAMDSVSTKINTVLNPAFDAAAERMRLFALANEKPSPVFNNTSIGNQKGPNGLTPNEQHALQNEASQHNIMPDVTISDEVLKKAGLLRDTINSIKPPNVGDAGLAVINTSTIAAQNLGRIIGEQIRAPDIGDAGNQTIITATNSASNLGFTLDNQVREPDIGDAGRSVIDNATTSARNLGSALGNAAAQIRGLGSSLGSLVGQLSKVNIGSSLGKIVGTKSYDYGGFTRGAELASLHPNELVLPLSKPVRARELITQIPPGIMASLNQGKGQAVFAPSITVTGETLDTMEAAAVRAVQAAFRDARVMSGRQGGLITTGLGPSH